MRYRGRAVAEITETFAEYLENNPLTAEEIAQLKQLGEDFPALFVSEFCDSQIGFETETLFKIKFQARMAQKIPLYAERKRKLDKAYADALNPIKTDKNTVVDGDKTTTTWELPTNADPATIESTPPNAVNKLTTGDDTITHEYSGLTVGEAKENIKFWQGKIYDLYAEVYEDFKTLFLLIY